MRLVVLVLCSKMRQIEDSSAQRAHILYQMLGTQNKMIRMLRLYVEDPNGRETYMCDWEALRQAQELCEEELAIPHSRELERLRAETEASINNADQEFDKGDALRNENNGLYKQIEALMRAAEIKKAEEQQRNAVIVRRASEMEVQRTRPRQEEEGNEQRKKRRLTKETFF